MLDGALLAYIDPLAGSIILQAIGAALVGGAVFFRSTIARLFGKLRRRDRTNRPQV